MRYHHYQQKIAQKTPPLVKSIEMAEWPGYQPGKVRDSYDLSPQERLIITTDRQSAHDKSWGYVPCKGRVLTRLSQFWFEKTQDLCANHYLKTLDPNVMCVKKAQMLPVEVVVRAYLTGSTVTSLWQRYQAGERQFAGVTLGEGLSKNTALPQILVTPTTKALQGHDQSITPEALVSQGLVSQNQWQQMLDLSLQLFARGQTLAKERGFILVDTKYEFGLDEQQQIMLADELHTPDSSRYWTLESYQKNPQQPEMFDKEQLRLCTQALNEQNNLQVQTVLLDLAARYLTLGEELTGEAFDWAELSETDPENRIKRNVARYLASY